MTIPAQKTFGEFIADRFGPNWVSGHSKLQISYARNGERRVIITKKEQAQLRRDYYAQWGRDRDPEFWAMICALRTLAKQGEPVAIHTLNVIGVNAS